MERRVILAAGHGGLTRGALDVGAVAKGRTERTECIDIVNRTAAKLRKDGRITTVVVPHELGLGAGIAWINARFPGNDDGYCVEVHKNSGGGTGVEAWYLTGSEARRRDAETVLAPLSAVTRLRSRGVKPDKDNRHGRLGWVRDTNPAAALLECGFIDVDHFRNELYAEGLFRGFLKLFGLQDAQAQIYRVTRDDGTQIGAFRVRSNAWQAYRSVDGDAVILNREGRDVTSEFVDEFGSGPEAVPEPSGPPESAPSGEDETDDLYHDPPVETSEAAELLDEADAVEPDEVPAPATG